MLFPNRQRQPCLLHRRLEQQQIFPSLGLGCRRSKQIGGMVGRNRRHLPSIGKLRQMNAPPHLRDRKHFISRLQKRRNGKSPCEEKHIGLEQFKLPGKPVSAANNLFGLRISVARRAAFEHIQNHTVASAYQSERIEHGGQELAGFADKRNALKILLCPRCLSHHNEFRSGSAVGKDNMLTAHRRKRTSSAVL